MSSLAKYPAVGEELETKIPQNGGKYFVVSNFINTQNYQLQLHLVDNVCYIYSNAHFLQNQNKNTFLTKNECFF